MKKLNLEQMEIVNGGHTCGKAGGAMAIVGGILGIVALCNPITGLIGGLAAAYGASFGIAGLGCGILEFID
jgi:hypothetical protein